MANLSITISNQLLVVAPQDVQRWGTLEWGTDEWRSDNNTYIDVDKWLANSLSTDSQIPGVSVEKWLADGMTLTQGMFTQSTHLISEGFSLASGINFLSLKQGIWTYVLIGETDPDDRQFASWTEKTDQTDGWTEDTDPSTPWT